jgi:hypothetical protein
MGRFYVNITGVSQSFLDFLGYFVIVEDEKFKVLSHKNDIHFIDKHMPLDDQNDAELLKGAFRGREKIPLPPKGARDTP